MDLYNPPPPTLLDHFSPEKFIPILPTSAKPKRDYFKYYKPKKNQNLNYTISETFANLQQGDTIIKFKQTVATYSPKPVKKERNKLFSGGPPKWKFVDEILNEKREKLQEQYKREMQERQTSKKKSERTKTKGKHQILQDLVGPEWFQELSPKQIDAIDMLGLCIHLDMMTNNIIYTQENLATLGLVLRPNHHRVKFALLHCCGDPVEFLLTLYQIINPQRKKYSLNDRLILSSVVHLTMCQTLRELHIRIPSPPRVKPPPVPQQPKPKRIKYASPYLEPQTFYPEPRKFHGVYYNKHRQYPESPYFSYLPYLKQEQMLDIMNDDTSEDGFLVKELHMAQTYYEKLPGGSEMPKLLMPNIPPRCQIQSEIGSTIIKVPVPTLIKLSMLDFDRCFCMDQKKIADYENIIESLDDPENTLECECRKQTKQFLENLCNCEACQLEKWKRSIVPIFGGVFNGVPVISGVISKPMCGCLEAFINKLKGVQEAKYLTDMETKFVMTGISYTKEGPCYNISCVVVPRNEEQPKEDVPIEDLTEETTTTSFTDDPNLPKCTGCKEKAHTLLKKLEKSPDTCDCVKKYKEQVEKVEYAQSVKEEKHKIKSQKETKYIMGGVATTSEGPVYTLVGQQPKVKRMKKRSVAGSSDKESKITEEHTAENGVKKKCCCIREAADDERTSEHNTDNEDIDSEEDWCRCRDAVESMIKNQCSCDKCNMLKRQYNSTYVISGTKCTESGTVVNVMGGVKNNECTCLHEYYEKLRKLFEYRKRCRIRMKLKQQSSTYVVTGVNMTAHGPVYNLSCVKPPPECECGKIIREMKEEERRIAQMAKKPETGRVNYVISGVRAMPGENVYILSRALPTEECACMEMVKEFEDCHKVCMDTYEDFLKQVDEEIALYMEDIENDQRWGTSKKPKDDSCCCDALLEDGIVCKEYTIQDGEDEEQEEDYIKYLKQLQDDFEEENEGDGDKNTTCNCCTCYAMASNYSLIPEVKPITLPPKAQKEKRRRSSVARQPVPSEYESKRFYICSRFPEDQNRQIEILQRILESMAEDGFPLAKLPHCYKLPHFRLWWHLRTGTYWTLTDKITSVCTSKDFWNHSDFCYNPPNVPKLRLDKCKAKEFTWKNAKLIKNLCHSKEEMFYRKLRQALIESTREFFATTFSYEFPTKTFRDCFFAYQPAKEEEVFPFKVVQPYEKVEVPSYRKFPCYC